MTETFRYKFRVKWTAILGVLTFGILVPTFFIPNKLGSREHFLSILVASVTSYVIWEGSKFIQALTMYFFPWEKSIIRHLVYEIFWIFVFSSLLLLAGIFTYSSLVSSVNISAGVVLQNMFVSFLLALLFTAVNEGEFLFSKWKQSLVEQERLREENLIARVESLKKQLDPHFLFNSLSVLSGIIYKDPVLADKFISRLSQVYRYVLDYNEKKLVALQKEIAFAEAYCFLLNVRFYNKVILNIEIQETTCFVLPMSIQLLIENAVKHNKISDSHPMTLSLYIAGNRLWLANKVNPKDTKVDGSGIGLKNLEARYKLMTGKQILIEEQNKVFRVGLPLIFTADESSDNRR